MKKTVREWIEFLADENMRFGLKPVNASYILSNECYYTADEAIEKFEGWLDEVVVQAYPNNGKIDNAYYCLMMY